MGAGMSASGAGTGSSAIERLDALYEFDREPVSRDRLCGGGYFAASFAGEHVAATEFVIGALFVTWGAGITDIVVGLLVGNLLAVLSWALVCAPIAVRTRLTLYWYLRRIGGPYLTLIYNLLNALLFCILAGCMITVSASAVRIPFGIPEQVQWYPTSVGFVLVVLAVGAVVVTLAIAGFRRLASFAQVCAPWMLLMFLLGCLVMLPELAGASGLGRIRSLADFWELGRRAVWTGQTAGGGASQIGFLHVAAFAWICNLAMHLGLSDMALFRFARRTGYGYYSAFGMYLGHYLAWIWAGVMGAGAASALGTALTALDSGAVAFQALGTAGAVAVVIAGWTTSNPTLYRAGLALQAVTPGWPRWKVTLAAGALTTAIACFPFVFTRLLDFVGIYGLILVPAGVIVATEHALFPRLGLPRYASERRGERLNLPALTAWVAGLLLALGLGLTHTLHLFFLFLPTCLTTALVYTGLIWVRERGWVREPGSESPGASDQTGPVPGSDSGSGGIPTESTGRETGSAVGATARRTSPLTRILGAVAILALIGCLVPAVGVSQAGPGDYLERLAAFKQWLPIPTLLYFVSGTLWRLRRT